MPVTRPNCALPTVVFGAANTGWLNALKLSARNSRPTRSLKTLKRLNTERSSNSTKSARRFGCIRPTLPKVYCAGRRKAAVSNQRSRVGLSSRASLPVESGRWPPPKLKLVLPVVSICSGWPLLSVTIPLTCHWPSTALVKPFQVLPNFLPLPNGSS